ncbi:glycosyltransferase [Vibrio makurazakiensis]|uniref:glycosyltransferase family 2 protein n=1 Tax=Vibrio makurazakiensis TaxID=2910250 RepID=UPI003D12F804
MNNTAIQDKVSIYIPTYNRKDLLIRAINSVLGQSHKNLEVIVVDDNSSDGTETIMKTMVNEDDRVVYLRNTKNRGACHSRNRAIEIATGKFVTGLDDDDYFLPSRISDFINEWNTLGENVIGLYSNKSIKLGVENFIKSSTKEYSHLEDIMVANSVGNQIFTLRSTFSNTVKYDEGLKSWQDLDMWINILSSYKGTCLKNTGCYNYVLDKSHPHERISSPRVDKHLSSLGRISGKYSLLKRQSSLLRCQAYVYNARSIGLPKLLSDVITSRSFYVAGRMAKYYITNKKSH